ncbi:hypothetical protein BJ138DRAFT_1147969 [Hygrophoropsis aurantiaca]|uniref:Uncharacterized protein n=1 Tax=Hygrophoropsis aurantiaca TaxID=72124 RepID=A0ACB8AGS2_9AGAM|nr:hypothetical protein BJ138DRAFT_1147969 [Hygrophoropsis aurantiaca]
MLIPEGAKARLRPQEQQHFDEPPPPYTYTPINPQVAASPAISGSSLYPASIQNLVPVSAPLHVAGVYPPGQEWSSSSVQLEEAHLACPGEIPPDRQPPTNSPSVTSAVVPSTSNETETPGDPDSRHPPSPSSSVLRPNYLQSSYGTPSQSSASLTSSPPLKSKKDGLSLPSFFGSRDMVQPCNREPPRGLSYAPFPAISLESNTVELRKGFPELPPPCYFQPHPFVTHDVTEDDWRRFLADVKKAASLSTQQRIASNVVPIVTPVGIVGGCYVAKSIEKRMLHRNRNTAGELVDHWNRLFFNPRRMEIVLMQGGEQLSGRQESKRHVLRRRASSSSCSSATESERNWRHRTQGRSIGEPSDMASCDNEDALARKRHEKEYWIRKSSEAKAKQKQGIPSLYHLIVKPL